MTVLLIHQYQNITTAKSKTEWTLFAKLSVGLQTHADLLQEPHEARRRDDTDLPHESLRYRQSALLLAAAFWVSLQKEKAK